MVACRLGTDVDRRAAACAMEGADACRQSSNFGWRKLAYKTLFDHELREGRESSVILQTAVIGKTTTAHHIEPGKQLVPAARTTQG